MTKSFCFYFFLFFCVLEISVASGQISRKCYGSQTEAKVHCNFGGVMADVCEFCETDGCNGAAQYVPIAMMIISIPIAIMKLFAQ